MSFYEIMKMCPSVGIYCFVIEKASFLLSVPYSVRIRLHANVVCLGLSCIQGGIVTVRGKSLRAQRYRSSTYNGSIPRNNEVRKRRTAFNQPQHELHPFIPYQKLLTFSAEMMI